MLWIFPVNKIRDFYRINIIKSVTSSISRGTTMKILIIDDDKVDRSSLKRDLKNTHLVSKIVEAETGHAGIDRFREESFDCVLLDYYLPDKEGVEVLQELINIGGEFITIIAITGTASETMPERMIGAGASDYLIKDEIDTRMLERVLRPVQKQIKLKEKFEKEISKLTKKLEEYNNIDYKSAC
jgi:DNA-binding NarL/FixJ family response regulator